MPYLTLVGTVYSAQEMWQAGVCPSRTHQSAIEAVRDPSLQSYLSPGNPNDFTLQEHKEEQKGVGNRFKGGVNKIVNGVECCC